MFKLNFLHLLNSLVSLECNVVYSTIKLSSWPVQEWNLVALLTFDKHTSKWNFTENCEDL